MEPGDLADTATVNITKGVNIFGNVQTRLLSPSGAPAMTINAGVSDQVTLRDFVIAGNGYGQPGGSHGIVFTTGHALRLINMGLGGFGNGEATAVKFFSSNGAGSFAKLQIFGSSFNGVTGNHLWISPDAGNAAVQIVGTHFENSSGNSINISSARGGTTAGSLENVEINGVGNYGLYVAGGANCCTTVTVDRSVIRNTKWAVQAVNPKGNVFLNNSQLTFNATGVSTGNGGHVFSTQTNLISANGADVAAGSTLDTISQK